MAPSRTSRFITEARGFARTMLPAALLPSAGERRAVVFLLVLAIAAEALTLLLA